MSCFHCHCNPCQCDGSILPSLPNVPAPAPILPTGCVIQNPAITDPEECTPIPQLFIPIDCIVIPDLNQGINVSVCDAERWLLNCCVVIKWATGAANLRIASIDIDNDTLFLVNDGFQGNPVPGIPTTKPTFMFFQGNCPPLSGGADGLCIDMNALVEEAFTAPDLVSTALMRLNDCTTAVVGQGMFVSNLGCIQIQAIPEPDQWEITVTQFLPGVIAGDTVPAGSFVVPSDDCFGGVISDDSLDGDGTPGNPLIVAAQPSWLACHDLITVPVLSMNNRAFVCGLPPGSNNHPLFIGPEIIPGSVPITSARHDNFSGLDLPNNGYIIPKNGEYHIHSYVQTSELGPNGDYTLALAINDNEIIHSVSVAEELPSNFDTHLFIVGNFRLLAGDVVKTYVYHDAGAGPVQTALNVEVVSFGGFYVNP